VLKLTDEVWRTIPWTAETLNAAAITLESQLNRIEVTRTDVRGPAGDPHFEWLHERDSLEMCTLYELGSHLRPEHLDDTIVEHLRQIVAHDDDQARMVQPASRIIALYEGADSASV
jgi:hypothetical protein